MAHDNELTQPTDEGRLEPTVRPHFERWGVLHIPGGDPLCERKPDGYWTPWHLAEQERLRLVAALKRANDQAEHFERSWYLAKMDADRYAFAKTLEGQVVTMEALKNRGAAELDQELDDAMAEDADARNEAGYAA